ncbi:hypothetical protein MIZ01_2300 [Sideroxyarcus emersonii]|uniref:Lipoprotein LPP20-like domain-containing protein n=1 Tax=Sideroxyarcus emersonii TaxID=2764705 RepID=A0AAN1XBL8_9PROT|nr:LPP20 family lipoprotein [Sideroxyarcus emersonii]BCK88496.1 hypothetical protein MIZ01_2300 [Sideroxyarcus emersonii]
MGIVRKLLPLALILSVLGMPAAAWAGRPDWVSGESAEYPNDQYLVGRGEASTEAEAQDRARGDLATIFEVRIQVANENATTVVQSGSKEQLSRQSSQQVSARTDKVISGITIAGIWFDPETADYHAFAVLSRAQAAASLSEELGNIDKEIQQDLQAANQAGDLLLKVGALTRASQAAIRRDGFQASLKVIDPSGRGVQSQVSQASVQQMIDDTLKRIRIAPEVVQDGGAKSFASILKGGLAAAGFLATGMEDADLVLEGKLTMTDIGRQEGWNWMRATVEVSLVEKASRRVRGTQTWPVKASAQDARTARTRALIEVEKLLKQELRPAIVGFAAS